MAPEDSVVFAGCTACWSSYNPVVTHLKDEITLVQDCFELGVILLRKKLYTQATKNLEKASRMWDGEPEELAQVCHCSACSPHVAPQSLTLRPCSVPVLSLDAWGAAGLRTWHIAGPHSIQIQKLPGCRCTTRWASPTSTWTAQSWR